MLKSFFLPCFSLTGKPRLKNSFNFMPSCARVLPVIPATSEAPPFILELTMNICGKNHQDAGSIVSTNAFRIDRTNLRRLISSMVATVAAQKAATTPRSGFSIKSRTTPEANVASKRDCLTYHGQPSVQPRELNEDRQKSA